MKLSKKFMKTLFTILILIFVLIPIINYFSNYFIKNTPYFEGNDFSSNSKSNVLGLNNIFFDDDLTNDINNGDIVTGVTPVIEIINVTDDTTSGSKILTLKQDTTFVKDDTVKYYSTTTGTDVVITDIVNSKEFKVTAAAGINYKAGDFIAYNNIPDVIVTNVVFNDASPPTTTVTLDKNIIVAGGNSVTFSPTPPPTTTETTDPPPPQTTASPWLSSADVLFSGEAVEAFTDKPTTIDNYTGYEDSSINFITNINDENEDQCSRYLTVSTNGTEGKLLNYNNSKYPYSTNFMNSTDCQTNNNISKALEEGDIDVSLNSNSTSWDLSFNAKGTNFTGTREDNNNDYLTVTDGTNTEKWYIKYDSYTPSRAKYDVKMKDLITNTSNYQYDACINRIDVSGIDLSPFGGTGTGALNEYIYCLGGTIKCGGVDASLVTGDNWSGGNTYRATCDDTNFTPTCNPKSDRVNTLVINGNKYDGTDVTTAFEFMGDKNFTGPYNYVPIEERQDGYISVRSSASESFFTQTNCLLYDTSNNCSDYLINLNNLTPEDREGVDDTTNDTTDGTTTTEEPKENSNKIKCVADNGAEIGDNVCCNQKGVVQNTIYNCPSEFPKCIGYKCGESWGYCASSSSEIGEYIEDETTTAAPE